MDANTAQLTQAMLDFLTWFLMPFAVFVAVEWVVRLFKYND